MFTLLSFAFVIVIVVFFHELGHFLFARLFGVGVEVFSVGMGPKILAKKDKYNTEWRLCLLPLGGYVKMAEKSYDKDQCSGQAQDHCFESKPLWQRISIIFAGPLASLLLGWILFFGIFTLFGKPVVPQYKTQGIGAVLQGGSAQKAGLQAGDIITHIDAGAKKYDIGSFRDLYASIQKIRTQKAIFTVKRASVTRKFTVQPRAVMQNSQKDAETKHVVYQIGIKMHPVRYQTLSLQQTFFASNTAMEKTLRSIYYGYTGLLSGQFSVDDFGGPIKIAQFSGQAAHAGWQYFIGFIAILSINLAVINMLPIPVMDGGRILLLCIEGILRRPLSPAVTRIVMGVSVWFLLGVFILVTLNDLNIF